MGAGSRSNEATALPPEQFHCSLENLPRHLVPRRHLKSLSSVTDPRQPLFLNPHCVMLSAGHLPTELQTELVSKFALNATIVWVSNPGTRSQQPFWPGPRLERIISNLRPGELASNSVPLRWHSLLRSAGILVLENEIESWAQAWSQVMQRAALKFKENGYAPLAHLIHPFNLAALRRYYRHQIRRGIIQLGDHQSALRYVAHNESVARFFHHQLATAVSAVVGEPVKPSYVYFASYLSGAELNKHTDRAQCEFSVTLSLDFSPEPDFATPWPIRLETPYGTTAVYQALGDGLVYRGTKVPHYRTRLAEGHTSTSIFFHYVPGGFAGSLQ